MVKLSIEIFFYNLVKLNMIYKIVMKSDLNCFFGIGVCLYFCMFLFIKKVGERSGLVRLINENDII